MRSTWATMAAASGPASRLPVRLRRRSLAAWLAERIFIVNVLGALLTVLGCVLLLPLVAALVDGEVAGGIIPFRAFALPAIASILAGLLAQRGVAFQVPSVRGAMVITALGWILIGVVGAVPFVIALHKPFVDALFESVSGFTTTGITVFQGLDTLPPSILLWRSTTQWLGGLGILTFFLAVSFRGGTAAASLFGAEGHKVTSSRPVPGIFNTVKVLWGIYLIFTAVSFFAYLLGGMSAFDALNHCLTTISTGGFSTHDESMGYFAAHGFAHAGFLEYAAIFFMLAGGINFLVHYKVLSGQVRSFVSDFEMRWFWGIVAAAVALIALDHVLHSPAPDLPVLGQLAHAFRKCFFQVASLITSTGFATEDIGSTFFPALSKQIFLILMLIGGCVGSTAGGMKVLRVGILAKMFRAQIARLTMPSRSVSPVVLGRQLLATEELQRIGALLFMWLALIAVGAGLTAFFSELDAWQSLSGMVSAVGNMGPFYSSVGDMASSSPIIKMTYVVGMLAGRLEILPLAVLFCRSTWR